MFVVFLQSLLPRAAKAKPAPAGPPAPASHGWLCCRGCFVATSHPKTLCIFCSSCSFPSEASPSSSALVRSPWRRPQVLSTWSTTERNKDMTVHGEDDSRDPAARSNFVFLGRRRVSTGLCGSCGPSSRGFYLICLAHDQSSLFFFLSKNG